MLVIDTSQKVSPNGDLGSENQKQRKQLNQNRSCHKKKEAPPPRPHPYLNELQDLNSGTKKEMNQVYRRKVTTYEHIWRPSNLCWSMSVKPTLGWNSMITLGYSGYIAIICHNAGGMFAYVFFSHGFTTQLHRQLALCVTSQITCKVVLQSLVLWLDLTPMS
jgi:hypothetical protein